ncbi:MAG TPA: ATP-binding protein [Polyangiaceae bacterium]|nr:ATP-binding protein [Polyangiaceae bacterium]
MARSSFLGAPLAAVTAAVALGVIATALGAPLAAGVAMGVAAGGAMWLQRRALTGERESLQLAAATERAERSEQGRLLKAVVESAPMAIVVYGDTGKVAYCNAEARTLFAEEKGLEDQNFLRLVQRAPESLKQALVRDDDALFTVDHDGRAETYSLSRRFFDLSGERHTLLMVKELTPELGRQEIDVWKNVIRIINHELNNSLAPISSMVHSARLIAQNPEQLPKLGRVFATIEERTTHLTAFLEGYARFARLPKPRPERVAWQPFLDNLQALYPHARVGVAPTTDGWFDAAQLQQTLINLLKNATEACQDAPDVELTAEVAADGASIITVADRGSGMTDEVLRNALVPFFSTKEKGTGLGLALCREIVEAHRGKLRLARRAGGGMEITCWLPGKATVVAARTGRLTLTRA